MWPPSWTRPPYKVLDKTATRKSIRLAQRIIKSKNDCKNVVVFFVAFLFRVWELMADFAKWHFSRKTRNGYQNGVKSGKTAKIHPILRFWKQSKTRKVYKSTTIKHDACMVVAWCFDGVLGKWWCFLSDIAICRCKAPTLCQDKCVVWCVVWVVSVIVFLEIANSTTVAEWWCNDCMVYWFCDWLKHKGFKIILLLFSVGSDIMFNRSAYVCALCTHTTRSRTGVWAKTNIIF